MIIRPIVQKVFFFYPCTKKKKSYSSKKKYAAPSKFGFKILGSTIFCGPKTQPTKNKIKVVTQLDAKLWFIAGQMCGIHLLNKNAWKNIVSERNLILNHTFQSSKASIDLSTNSQSPIPDEVMLINERGVAQIKAIHDEMGKKYSSVIYFHDIILPAAKKYYAKEVAKQRQVMNLLPRNDRQLMNDKAELIRLRQKNRKSVAEIKKLKKNQKILRREKRSMKQYVRDLENKYCESVVVGVPGPIKNGDELALYVVRRFTGIRDYLPNPQDRIKYAFIVGSQKTFDQQMKKIKNQYSSAQRIHKVRVSTPRLLLKQVKQSLAANIRMYGNTTLFSIRNINEYQLKQEIDDIVTVCSRV